jgi:uncharacterized protein (DUF2267 family)
MQTPASLSSRRVEPATVESQPFLYAVLTQSGLEDIYDARDVTEVVFRTLRDIVGKDVVTPITAELESVDAPDTTEIVALWKDTNPLVALISRVRPPLEIASDTFFFRVAQEAGLSKATDPKVAVKAVFAQLKARLSSARAEELRLLLPEQVQQVWRQA